MLVFEIIRVALQAIGANKMRSLLTMLGIVIGVGAVITMVALGTGAQQSVESQLQALGTDVLTVRPGQGWHRGVRSSNARMYLTDAAAVESGTEAITLAAPEMVSNNALKASSELLSTQCKSSTARIKGIICEPLRTIRFNASMMRSFIVSGLRESSSKPLCLTDNSSRR